MVVYGGVHFEHHHGFCSADRLCTRGSKVGTYLTPSTLINHSLRLELTDRSYFYSRQGSHSY